MRRAITKLIFISSLWRLTKMVRRKQQFIRKIVMNLTTHIPVNLCVMMDCQWFMVGTSCNRKHNMHSTMRMSAATGKYYCHIAWWQIDKMLCSYQLADIIELSWCSNEHFRAWLQFPNVIKIAISPSAVADIGWRTTFSVINDGMINHNRYLPSIWTEMRFGVKSW